MTFQQLPLFNTQSVGTVPEPAPTRRNASETSRAAGVKLARKLGELQDKALQVIRAAGQRGATFDEVAQALGWEQNQSGRVTALKDKRLIVERGTRPTRRGNNATVYVAREFQ